MRSSHRSSSREQPRQSDEDTRTDDRHDDAGDETAARGDAKDSEQVAADDCAGDAEDDVPQGTEPRTLHELSGGPASDEADDDPPNETTHESLQSRDWPPATAESRDALTERIRRTTGLRRAWSSSVARRAASPGPLSRARASPPARSHLATRQATERRTNKWHRRPYLLRIACATNILCAPSESDHAWVTCVLYVANDLHDRRRAPSRSAAFPLA